MANLPESNTYPAGIYQIELTDPVVGGVDGVSNAQARQLANRTNWLKQKAEELVEARGGFDKLGDRLAGYDAFSPEQQVAILAGMQEALGLGGVLSREMQVKYGTLPVLLWQELFAILFTLPLGVPALFHSSFSWSALVALFVLGAAGTGFAYVMYGMLMVRAGAVRGRRDVRAMIGCRAPPRPRIPRRRTPDRAHAPERTPR